MHTTWPRLGPPTEAFNWQEAYKSKNIRHWLPGKHTMRRKITHTTSNKVPHRRFVHQNTTEIRGGVVVIDCFIRQKEKMTIDD